MNADERRQRIRHRGLARGHERELHQDQNDQVVIEGVALHRNVFQPD
ncbi:MAG: hypothetical protein Q7T22_04145 [Serpentinimonas sp.]|nr:hypothetical protein [Serpentinimonas sp.]MDO9610875.1 hypothetical protein [Serpentinimonas sp.]